MRIIPGTTRIVPCGIYKITNKVTGECYVGKSCDLRTRFAAHLRLLAEGMHYAKKLQQSFFEHGIVAFSFEFIEICDDVELGDRERYWIHTIRPALNTHRFLSSLPITPEMSAEQYLALFEDDSFQTPATSEQIEDAIATADAFNEAAKKTSPPPQSLKVPVPILADKQKIVILLDSQEWRQHRIAKALKITQPAVSKILATSRKRAKQLRSSCPTEETREILDGLLK